MKKMMTAIFGAALLIPLFVAAQEGQTIPPAANERPGRMLARESLGLTSDQEKALEEFRKTRLKESQTFREEMTKIQAEMRELAKDPEANQTKLDALIDKTAQLRAGREKATFRNRAERDNIFTPEQLEKIKAMRERFAGRAGLAGPGRMGSGRMGFRGPGMGRFMGPGFGMRQMGRFGAFPHRPCPGRRRRR
jgi:Spy/CpxP family protein refolding chaperone